jgi:hypothetical protein
MQPFIELFRTPLFLFTLLTIMTGANLFGQAKLAAVKYNGKWGFIDQQGNWQIKPQFEALEPFSEGLAGAKLGGSWEYVDQTGEWIIQTSYKRAEDFSEGLGRVIIRLPDNDKWIYLDKEGNQVLPNQFENCQNFSGGLAAARTGKNWGYIDKTGLFVIPEQFEHAEKFMDGWAPVTIGGWPSKERRPANRSS